VKTRCQNHLCKNESFTVMSWRFLATSLRQFGTRTELILYRSHRIRDQIISALVDDLDRVASQLKGKGVSFAKELQTPRPGSHVLHSSFFWLAYGSVPLSFLLEGFERQ
jgi:hypothetical protein